MKPRSSKKKYSAPTVKGRARSAASREKPPCSSTIKGLTRAIRTLGRCNDAVIHAAGEQELLDGVCRIIVEEGGYRMAWVGFRENDAQRTVRPVARAGYEARYIEALRITWADTDRGRGPTGTAIRTEEVTAVQNIAEDPRFAPWRQEALKRGYRAAIGLPLRCDNAVFGALTIYAEEPDAFDADETGLLTDLANNLSFGINTLRVRRRHGEASEKLASALRDLEGILAAIPDVVFKIDRNFNLLTWNHAAEEVTGLAPDRLHGAPALSFFAEEDRPTVERVLARCLEKGAYEAEIPLLNAAGIRIAYSWKGAVLRDESGVVQAVLGTGRDITGAKRNENDLRLTIIKAENERAKLGAMLEAIGDGVTIHDTEYRILYQNRAIREIMGDHLGEYCYRAYAGKKAPCTKCAMTLAFSDGRTHRAVRTSDRGLEPRSYDITASPIRDAEGAITGGIEVLRDITEHIRADAERAKLVELIENSSELIALATLDARPLFINQAGRRMLGLGADDEVTSARVVDYYPPEHVSLFEQTILPAMLRGESWRGELSLRNLSTGGTFPVEVTAFPVRDHVSGKPIALATVTRDITERKLAQERQAALQEQLLQSQKMDAINRLAGGIAHDFNNILTAIIGYGTIALRGLPAGDRNRHPVEQVLTAARRAAELTKNLLTFSRKQLLTPRAVEVNAVVDGVAQMLRRIIGEDVELHMQLSSQSAVVTADPVQIEQVMVNLATNARDAMPRGGTVTIRTGTVLMGEDFIQTHGYGKPGIYALIAVTDTGTGMEESVQRRAFEPFFTTKEVGKGTGLGLSIIYGIVKQHDGYVTMESEPDRGTTITVYLPLREAPQEEAAAARTAAVRGGDETILLAEDDSVVRGLEKNLLEEQGYTVVEAVDGLDAVQKLREHQKRIKLLISDIIMPKKSGKEVFEEAKKMKPGIKALFVSGYSADLIKDQELPQQDAAFMAKPVAPDDLLRKVREVLDA